GPVGSRAACVALWRPGCCKRFHYPRGPAMPVAIRLILLCLVVAAFTSGCAKGPRVQQPGPEFSVLTLNIWHDQRDWPARKAIMVEEIRRLNPDVICLQEVLQRETLPN